MSELAAFAGRWAVVTGAGDGIGRVLAGALAQRGLKVVVGDVREDAAKQTAEMIIGAGGHARSLAVDVSDRSAMMDAARMLADSGASPSLVFANAGVGAGAGLLEASPRTVEWVLGVNVLGVIWTAQAFVPHMLMLEGPRHLVVTASSASIVDVQGPFTLYAASKQCTAAVGEALTAELTPKGVGVTILYPGLLNTNIWDAARARPERFGGPTRAPESIADYWRNAQNPEVLVAPLFKTVAAGGGRCVVDTTREARPLFEQRTRRISDAFA